MQASIVPIAGKLLDYPGLILAFLFALFTAIAYLLSNTKLFLPLALVAIATITTFYVGIFEPGLIGWDSTYTFDGILLATLVMVAVDTFVWPSPPEPRLLESLAADLASTRRRFRQVARCYLDPSSAPLPAPLAKSRLAPTLALFKSVEEHTNLAPRRRAVLLDAITTSEHVYLEVERLAVLADDPGSSQVHQKHRQEIETSLKVIDAALAEQVERTRAGLPELEEAPFWVPDLRITLQRLSEMTARTLPAAGPPEAIEQSNFLGFVAGLEAIANLLEPRQRPPVRSAIDATEVNDGPDASPLFDEARFRFSVKLGAAVTLGLLVGLTTQRADLQTILWSIAVAGQPNQYGAVVRKTILRLAGCIMGGLLTLATMLLVSQNFESLPPYLVAIFVVTMFSTYVAQSSEWLGYAGIQTGITFLICYVGLAPSSDVYRPLWRFWGIVLGVLTTGFVFLFLWPEYASDKVIDSLDKLTQTVLAFAKEVAGKSINESRVAGVEQRVSANLLEVMTMADQARLEGRRGSAISEAAIEASVLLIRIAYRFEMIGGARLAGSEADLPLGLRERFAALEQEYCSSLESELAKLRSLAAPGRLSAPALEQPDIEITSRDKEQVSIPRSQKWTGYTQGNYEPHLETYQRMAVLLSRLDLAFSKIAAC
jgi:uncharacterized membrane protein YccC